MNGLIIIDTDILIDAGRGIDEAIEYLEMIEERSNLAISAITQMELMVGCVTKKELQSTERFLTRFEIINLNESITIQAIELLREYKLSHGLLIADALIAATAIHLNLPFTSKNRKDYRFIQELDFVPYLSHA